MWEIGINYRCWATGEKVGSAVPAPTASQACNCWLQKPMRFLSFAGKGCGLWFGVWLVITCLCALELLVPASFQLWPQEWSFLGPRRLSAAWLEAGPAGTQPQLWHHLKCFSNVLILYLHFFGSKWKAKRHFKHYCSKILFKFLFLKYH